MVKLTLVIAATLGAVSAAQAQFHSDRLSSDHLSVMAPSARVNGAPGDMRIVETSCPSLPMADARRRILNIAVQEWGFFGFNVLDQTSLEESDSRDRSRRRGPSQ